MSEIKIPFTIGGDYESNNYFEEYNRLLDQKTQAEMDMENMSFKISNMQFTPRKFNDNYFKVTVGPDGFSNLSINDLMKLAGWIERITGDDLKDK